MQRRSADAIRETEGFGQFPQNLTLGSVISFDLAVSRDFSGVDSPDRLVVSLLDPDTGFTLAGTDLDVLSDPIPYQVALLVLDLVAGAEPLLPSVFNVPVPVSEPGALDLDPPHFHGRISAGVSSRKTRTRCTK